KARARPRGPGRPADYAGKVARAEQVEALVAKDVEAARQRQERLREQLQGFSDADHPFDLQTGQAQSAEAVRGRLQGRLEALRGLAGEARLGPKATQAVAGVGSALAGVVGVVAW